MSRVVITDSNFGTDEPERNIMKQIGAEVTSFQCMNEEDVSRDARDADDLLVQWAPITRRVIYRLNKAKVIGRYGIGVDNVDFPAATERGIQVVNVIYNIWDVADHTVALLMALTRKIPQINELTKRGTWNWREFRPINRLRNSTVGIIAYYANYRA